jgi:hypothetical protein
MLIRKLFLKINSSEAGKEDSRTGISQKNIALDPPEWNRSFH